MKKEKFEYKSISSGVQEVMDIKTKKIVGYKGGSHRGMALWKPGMKLFDANWKIPKTHKDYKRYEKMLNKNEFKDSMKIEGVIPFSQRGSKTIKTMLEAKQAAINFAKYIS